ncbi:benzoate membrane transport protein [Ditylenchus destructor]|nr:benzoate membrane transport protein [Ditylenchus destructor]
MRCWPRCDRHRIVGVDGAAGLQRFSPGSRNARVDNAALLVGGDHQHRHSAVRGRDDLAEHAGVAVLRADGYNVPASPLITATGLASLVLAPFGSHGINLAAISAAICTGPHAHEDRNKRYTAAVWCGVFYGIAGVFGATLAALFAALPKELCCRLRPWRCWLDHQGLSIAMNEPKEREAALITFMVTASG